MSDFEQGALTAFHNIFPNCHQSACLFHLGQSLARRIHSLPILRHLYATDENIRTQLRTFQSLAFSPIANIYSHLLHTAAALFEMANNGDTGGN
jgi:hypothetical protein